MLLWNRYGAGDRYASDALRAGARVIVAENGVFGRDAPGGPWYSLALHHTAMTGGDYRPSDEPRASAKIGEWRHNGTEVIVLAQRGIGPPGKAEPAGWHQQIAATWKFSSSSVALYTLRVRAHPGENPATPLAEELQRAACCITWASGAGIKALALGVPVIYGLRTWAAAAAGTHWDGTGNCPQPFARPDRAPIFRRLAWSTWNCDEIAGGLPLCRLLTSPCTGSGTTTAAR